MDRTFGEKFLIYNYRCSVEDCKWDFETYQSIKDSPLIECPVCKNSSLERVIHAAQAFVRGEPKSLGHLAEQNTDKLGRQTKEEMWGRQAEHKIAAKAAAREELEARLPAGASLPKVINTSPSETALLNKVSRLNPVQQEKYITTGKLP